MNFESLEIQKLNVLTDKDQRVNEKNVAICLVIMFTSRVMVFKMSKIGPVFVFYGDNSKELVTV